MSEAKHTPGDWKFQPSRLPGRKGCVVTDEDRICVVDHAEDGPLIAAAPGLLEACKRVVSELDGDPHRAGLVAYIAKQVAKAGE